MCYDSIRYREALNWDPVLLCLCLYYTMHYARVLVIHLWQLNKGLCSTRGWALEPHSVIMTLNTVDTYYRTYMLIQNYIPHKTTNILPTHSKEHSASRRRSTHSAIHTTSEPRL